MWVAFELQKLLTYFQQNISAYTSLDVNFNESLTNDIVSFEQLGPVEKTTWGFKSVLLARNLCLNSDVAPNYKYMFSPIEVLNISYQKR